MRNNVSSRMYYITGVVLSLKSLSSSFSIASIIAFLYFKLLLDMERCNRVNAKVVSDEHPAQNSPSLNLLGQVFYIPNILNKGECRCKR